MKGGIFISPIMKSLLDKMERIAQTAAARSPGTFFPYTQDEIAELQRLNQEYTAKYDEANK